MSAVFCQSLVWDQKWVMGRLKLALKLLSRKNWCQNSSAMLCWKTPGLAAGWMWAKDFHTSLLGESAYHSEHGVEINSFQFRFIVLRGGKFLKPRVKKKKKEHQYVNKSTYGKKYSLIRRAVCWSRKRTDETPTILSSLLIWRCCVCF